MINNKLRQAKQAWIAKKDYDRRAMPEIYEYNKRWRAENPGKYPYNDHIKDYILDHEKIDPELVDMLGTEIYLSQKDIQEEAKAEYARGMISKGFIPLDEAAIDKALTEKKKLHVIATSTNDWMTVKIDKVFKPHIFNGTYGLLPLRARTRGYSLHQFENAFCILV